MESKQPKHSQSKTSHPTILGAIFFTLLNIILLSTLSWILLEMWFGVHIIFSHNGSFNSTIQKIINNNQTIINHYRYQYVDIAFNMFDCLKNLLHSLWGKYINWNTTEIFLNITEITLTRCLLFIEFTPFMVVILCVLIVDGLVLRDKRKFQGARESTFLFHRLKPLAKMSFFSLFFIYMVMPYSVSPSVFLIPMVLLSSLFTMLAIKSFKKYL